MGVVSLKLARVRQLYEQLTNIRFRLSLTKWNPSDNGMIRRLSREEIFLKEKVRYTLKSLEKEVQPKVLYQVIFSNKHGETFRTHLLVENREEVELYFRVLEAVNNTWYTIHNIYEVNNLEKIKL